MLLAHLGEEEGARELAHSALEGWTDTQLVAATLIVIVVVFAIVYFAVKRDK